MIKVHIMYALSDQSQTILSKLSEKQYLQETRFRVYLIDAHLNLKNALRKVFKLNVELRLKKITSQRLENSGIEVRKTITSRQC